MGRFNIKNSKIHLTRKIRAVIFSLQRKMGSLGAPE